MNVSGSTANPNYTSQTQVVSSFNCPSDPSTQMFNNATGYNNYYASLGGTSSQLYGGSVPGQETNTALLGVFNVSIDENSPAQIGSQPNPDCQKVTSKTTLATITDGSSNTAMFAETTKSPIPAATGTYAQWKNNIYYVSTYDTVNAAAGGCPSINYMSGSGYSARIFYRGQMYYRNFTGTGYYAHTLPPNPKVPDCGYYANNTKSPASNPLDFMAAHIAARSYHPGGANAVMVDGSVHFYKDSIALNVWRALGTRAGGEVISADQY